MASLPTDISNAHDADGDHCHHHVASMFSLLTVLSILLVLTIATFAAYFIEIWISAAFDVHIPQWINVFIAMSIATVKATLVLMYFMHLRHDSQLYTVIMLFCVFAFALFLGLTGLDLGNRQTIFADKAAPIMEGGNNQFASAPIVTIQVDGGPQDATPLANDIENGGLALWTKDPAIARARLGDKNYEKLVAYHNAHAYHKKGSSAQMSRPGYGLTPGLYTEDATDDAHGSDH